jgi:FKBP-type peptidyl-prolyl cis-trans isomerase (trigger factor)
MASKNKKIKKAMQTKTAKRDRVQSVVAKSDDGNIQITYTIPYKKIKKAQSQALEELAKSTEVHGFRKGKAPKDVVKRHVDKNTLLEKSLSKILPNLVGETIEKENLKIAIYPKFQLLKAKEGEDWEVRAQTAEIPEFKLSGYKKQLEGHMRAKNLWVPGKDGDKEKKQLDRAEKEQEVIKALLEAIDIKIPKMLIEEEANSRLSKLLERIEKLGLNLDSYLASIGKKPADIRSEYEKQAKDTLALDLILAKIAEEEKIEVKKEDIDAAIKAASADKSLSESLVTEEKRRLLESILRKRAALNSLVSSF